MLGHAWWFLSGWTLLLAAIHVPRHGWSWHYIVTGVHALFSAAPLSLFAHHPELQMGPLTFVVAAPFVLLLRDGAGEVSAMVLMLVAGLAAVRELRLLAFGTSGPAHGRWFLSSLAVLAVWSELAVHWGHLDDALALLAGLIAVRLLRQGHTTASALGFALAVDFKPWALPLAVLLLLAPRRTWPWAATVFAAVVALAWLPFVLGDPQTLAALRFGIPVDTASTLHFVDEAAKTTPSWDRAAQAAVALGLGLVALWRRRWAAVPAIVIGVRLLLDPGTKNYYDAGLVLATALLDVATLPGLVPIATIAATALVYAPSLDPGLDPRVRGVLRAVALLGIITAALTGGTRDNRLHPFAHEL